MKKFILTAALVLLVTIDNKGSKAVILIGRR